MRDNPPLLVLCQTSSLTSPILIPDNPTSALSLTTNPNPVNVITIGSYVPTVRMTQWRFDVERLLWQSAGLVTFNASLFKNISINERWKFQFRAEFFNLFNTPAFSNPCSTFGTSSFATVGFTKGDNRQIRFAGKNIF